MNRGTGSGWGSGSNLGPDPELEAVLIVEDEHSIADLLARYVTDAGFRAVVVHTASDALGFLAANHAAAALIDIGLPDFPGTEICRRLRAAGNLTPVLFCTALDDEESRIEGLELGGDDYITKPYSPREVMARLRSVLRRTQPLRDAGPQLMVGQAVLDERRRSVTSGGVEVPALTATEFTLLAYLMDHHDRVVPREELLREVWGYREVVATRTVDVHIAQIRAKFQDVGQVAPIRTVHGVGYSCDG